MVRARYGAGWGNLTDLAGNPLPSGEIWIGGSGDSSIDLSNYGTNIPVALRGNGGNDTLIGTQQNDLLVDGGGMDTLAGSFGADVYRLVENGVDKAYARDVVRIGLGESPATGTPVPNSEGTDFDIVLGSLTSPTGTGFDIASATDADHDVLDLPSNTIAGNVSHFDGTDSGALAKHSISNGILTFESAADAAIAINMSNAEAAINYLELNITDRTTVAFEVDSDGDGSVDSLLVFQDSGTVPLAGNFVIPDVAVVLAGITGATLGTTAGAHVVQIQDTQAPNPVGFAWGNDGVNLDFAENAYATSSLAVSMLKNGTTTMNITSVDGSGTTSLAVHTDQTLLDTDWVLSKYTGSTISDGISDAAGNVLISNDGDPTFGGSAEGRDGDTIIDLSGAPAGLHFDLDGHAGNDTLTGSAGDDWINGGAGADTLTGGAGSDDFGFEQGDSPTVAGMDLGGDGVLNDGDTFSFSNGVDRITDLSSGEGLGIDRSMSDLLGNQGAPGYMGSAPSDGLATDQGYFALQGNYAGDTFTVDTTAGIDTLIVYDGDSSAAVAQAGIVLSGVTLADLNLYTGSSWISHV